MSVTLIIRVSSSIMSDKGKDQNARESFASILSYYLHNRESLENVPVWVDRQETGTITIGLKELLATQEAINKFSTSERQIMTQAANTSKARRKGAQ